MADEENRKNWGAEDAEQVVRDLDVDPDDGLDGSEVAERSDRHGPNTVQQAERDPAWRIFLDEFRNPLILLLIGAAAVAGVVGELRDTIVIASVLTLNAVIGFVQEYRAQKSMMALRSMLRFTARVRRDGREQEVDGSDLVPGDVVLLEAGERVPADGRIVEARDLSVNESTLTGESTPVDKSVDPTEPDAPLAERSSEVFMGTSISRGEAVAVVTATGMDSEMGRISARMREQGDSRSPLEKRLAGLAGRLSVIAVSAAAVVVGIAMARGDGFSGALLDGVVLAVASIPEGLPAIVTVTLALGMRAMARQDAIVDDLQAIHTLGASTVVCTDKTGTLTLNQMTVRVLEAHGARFEVSGEGYEREGEVEPVDGGTAVPRDALEVAVLCNDAEVCDGEVTGDPTEAALLVLGAKAGVERDEVSGDLPRVAAVPFSSERKYMATFHEAADGTCHLLVKGAPGVVFDMCTSVAVDDGDEDLDDARREELAEAVEDLTGEGYRVLALARRECDEAPSDDADVDERSAMVQGLRVEGIVAMEDPPRPEAADAVDECHRAGVAVKMVTGDDARTAEAIARRLGLEGETVEGRELDDMDDDELAERVERIAVLARVDPEHKVRVIDALAAAGHVVAMTGDGVNDAAALDRADVGIAMGERGTEVAKEAGDVVLTDDRIGTIVAAIRRGRTIYDNILTFVRFNLATNLAALLTILTARSIGLPTPFTPVQVLWVNLIMDGPPAMALGADPPADDVMERPPRDPQGRILDGPRTTALVALGSWMATGTLLVFWFGRERGGDDAVTLAFTTFVLFQVVNALNVRSGWNSVLSRRTFTNPALWAALVSVVGLQIAAVQAPFLQGLVDTESLSATGWLLAVGVAVSLLPASEVARWAHRRAVS